MPVTDTYDFEYAPDMGNLEYQPAEESVFSGLAVKAEFVGAIALSVLTLPVIVVAQFAPTATEQIKQDAKKVWHSESVQREIKGIKSLIRAIKK